MLICLSCPPGAHNIALHDFADDCFGAVLNYVCAGISPLLRGI